MLPQKTGQNLSAQTPHLHVELIQFVLKIECVEFEDRPKNLFIYLCESFSARRPIKEFST